MRHRGEYSLHRPLYAARHVSSHLSPRSASASTGPPACFDPAAAASPAVLADSLPALALAASAAPPLPEILPPTAAAAAANPTAEFIAAGGVPPPGDGAADEAPPAAAVLAAAVAISLPARVFRRRRRAPCAHALAVFGRAFARAVSAVSSAPHRAEREWWRHPAFRP